MATGGTKTSLSQAKAIAALMRSGTITEAAAVAGIGSRTLFRWLSDDAGFRAALAAAESEAVAGAARRLAGLADGAVGVLAEVLGDDAAPVGARLRAAGLALDSALTWRQLSSLEARLGALEQAVAREH